eukprot:SAG11_NODE_4082_length_2074_cov_0.990380_2_plen_115_part_00
MDFYGEPLVFCIAESETVGEVTARLRERLGLSENDAASHEFHIFKSAHIKIDERVQPLPDAGEQLWTHLDHVIARGYVEPNLRFLCLEHKSNASRKRMKAASPFHHEPAIKIYN